MNAHTPGPWTVTKGRRCWSIDAPSQSPREFPTRWLIAETVSDEDADEANARLIAAAPELLEALRDLCDAIPDETAKADQPLLGWIDQARATIAKVEGRS